MTAQDSASLPAQRSTAGEPVFTTRPEIRGTFGAIATTHWIASAVGMSMLERGGNAFDAAVAAGFTLQIVEPHLNGPGGDVPIIFLRSGEERPTVLCGQGVSPAAATIERFRDLGIGLVPGTGFLPAVVPGAFDAWMLLLRDHGTMRLRDILEPAISYARNGFPVLPRVAATIWPAAEFFAAEWPVSAEVWLPDGKPPRPGALIRTPLIAAAYQRIVDEAEAAGGDRERQIEAARNAFYRGFVAEAIDRYCAEFEAMDGTGRPHRGLLRADDLARWQASYEDPVSLRYRGLDVHKTGPWGQGPAMLEALALMEGFDVAAMAPDSAGFVHTVVECIKLAFADRDVFFGDPDFADVPLDTLLSPAYAEERRKLVGSEASDRIRPGTLGEADAVLEAILALSGSEETIGIGAGEPTFIDLPEVEGDTVHLDVVDRFGNLVSATPSGGWLQSSPAIPGLGFNLGTRGQMFWLDQRIPSALGPGRRPRTTLTPTLITRDGKPWLGLGSPGGDQQDQWTLATLLRHVDHRMNIQAAIDAPLFHCRHLVGSFFPREIHLRSMLIEGRFGEQVLGELRERGHVLSVQGDWALGRLCAAGYSRGMVRAAATPRFMQAYAIGR